MGIEVTPRPIPAPGKFGSSWRGQGPVLLELVREAGEIVHYCVKGSM